MSLLKVALKEGLILDPDNYLINGLPDPAKEKQFMEDKAKLDLFIPIYGIGNNQERGIKTVPRITIELQAYYPGAIGMERYQLEKDVPNYTIRETGYINKRVILDVHLLSKYQKDMRILHSILYKALPWRGYILPYEGDKEAFFSATQIKPNENIYIEVGNHYEHPDEHHGLLEHVYTYDCVDGVVSNDKVMEENPVPITDISVLLNSIQSNQTISSSVINVTK